MFLCFLDLFCWDELATEALGKFWKEGRQSESIFTKVWPQVVYWTLRQKQRMWSNHQLFGQANFWVLDRLESGWRCAWAVHSLRINHYKQPWIWCNLRRWRLVVLVFYPATASTHLVVLDGQTLKKCAPTSINRFFWIYLDVFWNMYSLVAHLLVPQSTFDCRTSQMLMVAKWWKPCSLHWWRNAPLESCPLVFWEWWVVMRWVEVGFQMLNPKQQTKFHPTHPPWEYINNHSM